MTYNMTIEQIKSLLARFYEGQTTPEEERLLADFFRREDVPEDLQQDKQLFLLLAQTSDQEMPQDIAEEITAFVNNLGPAKNVVSCSGYGGFSSCDRWRCVASSANLYT